MVRVKSLKPKNNKAPSASEGEWVNVFVGFLIMACLAVCSIFYVGQINETATLGFEFKEIESKIKQEKEASQNLKIESARLKAISNLKESIDGLDMVKVSKVEYISGSGSTAMAR